jgi:tRNA pseudouridine38-40 synthase
MADYKSIVAYDGTEFEGFQRQSDGRRTVQGELENALRHLGWEESSLRAAGRTDRGAHARGQVVAFGLPWKHGALRLTRALNSGLPRDLVVRSTERVRDGFHPRYAALSRCYVYQLYSEATRDPLRDRRAWRVWPAPDMERMRLASAALVGRHDFGAFGSPPGAGDNTVRRVIRADWIAGEDGSAFRIEADAFLFRMVRRIVSALVAVGQGKAPLDVVERLLEDPGQRWHLGLAPARGLCLERVTFEADLGPAPYD